MDIYSEYAFPFNLGDLPQTDKMFSLWELDPCTRREMNLEPPLKTRRIQRPSGSISKRPYRYILPGCYAFYSDGTYKTPKRAEREDEPFVLYVGKAINLQARIQKHFTGRSYFLTKHLNDLWENDIPFEPMVAVWYTPPDERASLESKLIEILKPKYNAQLL